MPLLGHFSEFSLPEVLLLIGSKTGTLRLLDIPPHGILDLDLSQGEVQGMHSGGEILVDPIEIIQALSRAMQLYIGVFEFHLQPVASVTRAEVLTISHLALSLVLRFDELALNDQEICPVNTTHYLVDPAPELWMDPVLADFFEDARPYLHSGATASALSLQLGHEEDVIQNHLHNLKLIGFVQVSEELSPSEYGYLNEGNPSGTNDDFLAMDNAIQILQNRLDAAAIPPAYSASA